MTLSLSAQFACARASMSGWLLAAVPAIAFLALTKMVLTGSRNRSLATDPESAEDIPVAGAETHGETPAAPVPVPLPTPAIPARAPAMARPAGVVRPARVNGTVVMPR